MDDPTSPFEHSISALVAAGIFTGLDAGVLAPRFQELGCIALRAAVAETRNGALLVSEATPVGDRRIYVARRSGVFAWGQGPLLLALTNNRAIDLEEAT